MVERIVRMDDFELFNSTVASTESESAYSGMEAQTSMDLFFESLESKLELQIVMDVLNGRREEIDSIAG
ncbi:MAG TPA: hypothetical protein VGH16_15935 [Candidatus Binatia bacterium]